MTCSAAARTARPRPLPLLLLAALTLLPAAAQALCDSHGLHVWPPRDMALPTHPIIVLEGYLASRAIVDALDDTLTAELVAADHRVRLTVDARYIGAMHLNQALLRPTRPLARGTRYSLELTDDDGTSRSFEEAAANGEIPQAWTTTGSDTRAPRLAAAPAVTGESYKQFGCGPSSHVQIAAPIAGGEAVIWRVTVKELEPEGPATDDLIAQGYEPMRAPLTWLVIPRRDGRVLVGHGMCSGGFRLTGTHRRFVAELTALDAAGNTTDAPKLLRFPGVFSGYRRFQPAPKDLEVEGATLR